MDLQLLKKLMIMARIELDEVAQQAMLKDLEKIFGWIEQLQAIDTEGIEPLTTLSSEQPILREDIPQPPLDHQRALSNTAYSDSNYFNVPGLK
jgi:aspartyl-tRNA(Asn)/glutamyl-tRNA(Gln) amidotransferase subunit C